MSGRKTPPKSCKTSQVNQHKKGYAANIVNKKLEKNKKEQYYAKRMRTSVSSLYHQRKTTDYSTQNLYR